MGSQGRSLLKHRQRMVFLIGGILDNGLCERCDISGAAYLIGGNIPDRVCDVTAGCGRGRCFQVDATGCAVEGIWVSTRSTSPTNYTAHPITGLQTYIMSLISHNVSLLTLAQQKDRKQETLQFQPQQSHENSHSIIINRERAAKIIQQADSHFKVPIMYSFGVFCTISRNLNEQVLVVQIQKARINCQLIIIKLILLYLLNMIPLLLSNMGQVTFNVALRLCSFQCVDHK